MTILKSMPHGQASPWLPRLFILIPLLMSGAIMGAAAAFPTPLAPARTVAVLVPLALVLLSVVLEAASEPFLVRCIVAGEASLRTNVGTFTHAVEVALDVGVTVCYTRGLVNASAVPTLFGASYVAVSLLQLIIVFIKSRATSPLKPGRWTPRTTRRLAFYSVQMVQQFLLNEGERTIIGALAPTAAFTGAWAMASQMAGIPLGHVFTPVADTILLASTTTRPTPSTLRPARPQLYIATAAVLLGIPFTPAVLRVVYPSIATPTVIAAVRAGWLTLPLHAINFPLEAAVRGGAGVGLVMPHNGAMLACGALSMGLAVVGTRLTPATCVLLAIIPPAGRVAANLWFFRRITGASPLTTVRAMVPTHLLALPVLGAAAVAVVRQGLPAYLTLSAMCGIGAVSAVPLVMMVYADYRAERTSKMGDAAKME